jgi:hypothetical protein
VEERRAARIGTLSGLALLAGATALIAASSGAHSAFATCLLSLLAVGMAHALLDEIRRQARRRSAGGWAAPDTINTVLLGAWSAGALAGTLLITVPTAVRLVGLTLAGGYALSSGYFAVERRRAVAFPAPAPAPTSESPTALPPAGPPPTGRRPTGPPRTGPPSTAGSTNTDVMPGGSGMSSR